MTSLRCKLPTLCLLSALGLAFAIITREGSAVPSSAQLNPSPAKPATTAGQDKTVTYDAGYSRWLSAPRTVEMSQGVSFQQGEAFLKTDAAVVHLDNKMNAINAESVSKVHVYDPSNDLVGDSGYIDFVHHQASLHGNVVLVTERKAPGETDDVPARLTCDMISYDYRKKVGTVPGPLTVHEKDRVLHADQGVYDTAAQTVTLTGNVHGQDSRGNMLQGPTAIVSVKPGQESVTLQGPIHGSFSVPDDDTTTTTSKKQPAGAPATEQRSSP
jgi:lipopolysaccharide export system protein LptA